MYRRSYFYHQLIEEPKKTFEREAVKVDTEKFSIKEYFKWLYQHGAYGQWHDPSALFRNLLFFTAWMVTSYVLTRPWKIYYDYKDPLLSSSEDSLDGISAEATLRRLKYKQKVSDWQ